MKNYTQGARRRAKRALPEIESAPRRKSRGRKRMDEIKTEPHAEKTVLEARSRHSGGKDVQEVRHPVYSEPAGQAIMALQTGRDAQQRGVRLWDTFVGFTTAEDRYARRYLGLRLHAKTAKLEMMPERVETRPDDTPDLRSDAEKDRDAVNNWMRWRGFIGHLPSQKQQAIFNIVYGRSLAMEGGEVTSCGRQFVDALSELANVVERRT